MKNTEIPNGTQVERPEDMSEMQKFLESLTPEERAMRSGDTLEGLLAWYELCEIQDKEQGWEN